MQSRVAQNVGMVTVKFRRAADATLRPTKFIDIRHFAETL